MRKNYRDQFITTEVAIAELVPTSIAPTIAELSFGHGSLHDFFLERGLLEEPQLGRLGKSSSRAFLISNRFVRCDHNVDLPIVVMARDKFAIWEKLLAEAYGDYFDLFRRCNIICGELTYLIMA